MKICICDSKNFVLTQLQKHINDSYLPDEAFIIRRFFSSEEMFSFSENSDPFDAYFINIDEAGLETAEIVRRFARKAIIIIVSKSKDRVFDSFIIEPFYYLLLPVENDIFSEVFKRLIAKYKDCDSSISLRWKSERYIVKIDDIIYIEGYNRHLTYYTKNGEYRSMGQLQSMCEKLYIHDFLQIHQGYLVNMNHIKSFTLNEVEMTDGTKVLVSTRRRSASLASYDGFLQRRYK